MSALPVPPKRVNCFYVAFFECIILPFTRDVWCYRGCHIKRGKMRLLEVAELPAHDFSVSRVYDISVALQVLLRYAVKLDGNELVYNEFRSISNTNHLILWRYSCKINLLRRIEHWIYGTIRAPMQPAP